ncbi:MAG: kelch repeat-containing protein [Planctomycetota bacterium]
MTEAMSIRPWDQSPATIVIEDEDEPLIFVLPDAEGDARSPVQQWMIPASVLWVRQDRSDEPNATALACNALGFAIDRQRSGFRSFRGSDGIYLFGGRVLERDGRVQQVRQAKQPDSLPTDVLRFDPQDNAPRFRECGIKLPRGRHGFALAGCQQRVYLIGGQMGGDVPATTMDMFDFQQQKWTRLPALPQPVYQGSAASVGDFIYFAGGYRMDESGKSTRPSKDLWRFDPIHQRWDRAAKELPIGGKGLHLHRVNDCLLGVSSMPDGATKVLKIVTDQILRNSGRRNSGRRSSEASASRHPHGGSTNN